MHIISCGLVLCRSIHEKQKFPPLLVLQVGQGCLPTACQGEQIPGQSDPTYTELGVQFEACGVVVDGTGGVVLPLRVCTVRV